VVDSEPGVLLGNFWKAPHLVPGVVERGTSYTSSRSTVFLGCHTRTALNLDHLASHAEVPLVAPVGMDNFALGLALLESVLEDLVGKYVGVSNQILHRLICLLAEAASCG